MVLEQIKSTIEQIGIHRDDGSAHLITAKGQQFNWLFDLRRVFLQRESLEQICEMFWKRYATREPFQLAGLETAAIPLLTALMLTAPKERGEVNGFIVRKNRKTTGMGRAIEGEINNLPVLLVDDALNSGTSAEKARAVVSMHGATVKEMFVVVDFKSRAGLRWRDAYRIDVHALYSLSEFDLAVNKPWHRPTQGYRELWRTITPGGFAFHIVPKSAPLLVGNRIYRGCDAAKMQCFSAETGGLIWEYQATGAAITRKGIWSCPAHHAGRIYFGAYNGTVYCLDASDGSEVWTKHEGEWVGASPLIVAKHNLLYIGIEYSRPWAKGSLGAYDLDTGEKKWEHTVEKLQHGSAGYWESGDLVIWGSADHETLAMRAATGEIVWRFPTRRSVKYAPTVDEKRGLVAFASFDKSIYILDVATGNKRGEWETGEICYTTPLFAENKLFCGSGDRHLYVIDIDTMQLIKKIDLHARVYASPKRIGNRIIVGTSGGRVVEIDIDTLEIDGALQLPDSITNAVAISPDERRLFVTTYMNHLYAYERIVESLTTHDILERVAAQDAGGLDGSTRLMNFERIAAQIDTASMRQEVQSNEELWQVNTTRQKQIGAQRETESIFLRGVNRSEHHSLQAEDIHASVQTSMASHFPNTMRWVHGIAAAQGKKVARVLLAKLKPKGQVYRHIDAGEYYRVRDRYHLVLFSSNGSPMTCGDEHAVMQEGELWWFDNKQPHEAFNTSSEPRIHLIFDLE